MQTKWQEIWFVSSIFFIHFSHQHFLFLCLYIFPPFLSFCFVARKMRRKNGWNYDILSHFVCIAFLSSFLSIILSSTFSLSAFSLVSPFQLFPFSHRSSLIPLILSRSHLPHLSPFPFISFPLAILHSTSPPPPFSVTESNVQ